MKHMKHTLRLAAQDSRIHSARASVSRQFVMTQCVVVCDVHTRMHIHLHILSKILYRAHTYTLCVRGSLKNTPRRTVYLCEVRAHIRMHMPSKHTITQTRAIYTCIYIVSQKISTLDQNRHISTYTCIHPHTHHTHTLEHPTIQYNTHKHITRASVFPGFIIDMCDITQTKNWFCFVLQVLEEAYYFPVNASYATWFVIFLVLFFVENISETYHSTNLHKKYIISVIKRKCIISVIKRKCNVFVNASHVAWYV